LFGINLGLVFFINILQKRVDEALLLTAHNQALGIQLRQQEEMGIIYQDMRRIQHDFKHHLHTIQGLVSMNDFVALDTYLEKINDTVVELMPGVQTDNPSIDALLNAKLGRAKEQGIRIESDILLAPNLPFDDDKLCVLLGNLLDNATDATMRLPVENRWIKLLLQIKKKNFVIDIHNATDDTRFVERTGRFTRKENPERHGFGLSSVDRIVSEYGGFCQRQHQEKLFRTIILLPLPFTYSQMLFTPNSTQQKENSI
jgi:sensor histidine kinase regulating citrate/malate metabolism